jgi:hypothetical protein
MPRKTLEQRFLEKLDRRGDDRCWGWLAARDRWGYGQFWDSRRMGLAHRFAYQYFVSPVPNGLCVLHTCDNPECCNPRHLWLGTNAENVADRVAKGRSNRPIGERHPQARLTAAQVVEVRKEYTGKRGELTEFAQRFGVSISAIADIVRGRSWI